MFSNIRGFKKSHYMGTLSSGINRTGREADFSSVSSARFRMCEALRPISFCHLCREQKTLLHNLAL